MADLILGPVGGNGGHEFSGYAAPNGAKLCVIHVNSGLFVDGIQLVYSGTDGVLVELPHVGGKGGLHHTVTLDADEYLVGISGRCGRYVDSIRFHTNKRTTDRYGGHGGDEEFSFEAEAGSEVVGLFGRAAWFVDQIGIIVRERIAGETKGAAPAADLVGLPDAEPVKPPAPDLIAMPDPAYIAPTAPSLIGIPDAEPVEAMAPELVGIPDSEPIAVESAAQVTGVRTAMIDLGASVAEDDLIKIEGIGPKMAQVLGEAGITTFEQLAATSPARLREILDAAGNRYRMIDPTTWPQQAALAAAGDWSGFDALAAKLKGGRKA